MQSGSVAQGHTWDAHLEDDVIRGRSARTGVLAVAGIVAPLVFTVGFLLQEYLRRGEYDPVVKQISDLEAGPYDWVQQVNFAVFGVLLIAFAVGLHRGVRPTRAGVAGPILLGSNGVGLVVAAVFPMRGQTAGVHSVNGTIFFLGIGVALVAVSHRLRGDRRWRGLGPYTLATGIVLVALFVAVGVLAARPGAPLYDWRGLVQRLVLAVWFPCLVVMAVRLWRVATGGEPWARPQLSDPPRNPVIDVTAGPPGTAPGRPTREAANGTPRWATVFGIVLGMFVALFVVMVLHGGGPPLPGGR